MAVSTSDIATNTSCAPAGTSALTSPDELEHDAGTDCDAESDETDIISAAAAAESADAAVAAVLGRRSVVVVFLGMVGRCVGDE